MPDVENEMKVYIPSTRNTEKVLLRTDIWTDKKWAVLFWSVDTTDVGHFF